MANVLEDMLAERDWLLADGATGTNYFAAGLKSGEPPENWNTDQPDKVRDLHAAFIDAGSDLILTNSFGGSCRRLMMHGAQDRVHEINSRAAELARSAADAAGRPVVVAGSLGPTGDLMEPLGTLTRDEARDAFGDQAVALAEGGADVLWCETMSAEDEVSAAVEACSQTGLPIVVTMSFDSGGRTMMGIKPADWPGIAAQMPSPLTAYGANCGVGPAELLATVIGMSDAAPPGTVLIAKGNCGMPEMTDAGIEYTGTTELMADYAVLARDAGVKIIGGCCGTTPAHIAAMRQALEHHNPGEKPSIPKIIDTLGEVSKLARGTDAAEEAKARRRRK